MMIWEGKKKVRHAHTYKCTHLSIYMYIYSQFYTYTHNVLNHSTPQNPSLSSILFSIYIDIILYTWNKVFVAFVLL